jgi:ribosome-associated protein
MLAMPVELHIRLAAARARHLEDRALLAECDEEFFVAGGPGGQHRNRTASGVRLVHPPTGVVVTATERRSQAQNRATALARLRAQLAALSRVPKSRKPTRPTRASQRRRIDEKKRHGRKKAIRRGDPQA